MSQTNFQIYFEVLESLVLKWCKAANSKLGNLKQKLQKIRNCNLLMQKETLHNTEISQCASKFTTEDKQYTLWYSVFGLYHHKEAR